MLYMHDLINFILFFLNESCQHRQEFTNSSRDELVIAGAHSLFIGFYLFTSFLGFFLPTVLFLIHCIVTSQRKLLYWV